MKIITHVASILIIMIALMMDQGESVHLRASRKATLTALQGKDIVKMDQPQAPVTNLKEANPDTLDPTAFVDAAAVDSTMMNLRKQKKTNVTIEIRTATILHGLNATLRDDAADVFAECYLLSYNSAANIYHGVPIDSLTEDTQFVVDMGAVLKSSSSRSRVRGEGGSTRGGNSSRALKAATTATRRPVVVFVSKAQIGSQCALCGDDRLLEEEEEEADEDQGDAVGLNKRDSDRQRRRELVYAAFEKQFFKCLQNSGQSPFARLSKLEVQKLKKSSLTLDAILGIASYTNQAESSSTTIKEKVHDTTRA